MKIVFYTCATGPEDGFIPSIKEEMIDGIECYFLHDEYLADQATMDKGWKYINLNYVNGCPANPNMKQRFGKILSHKFFPDADVTIYLDNKWYLNKAFFNFLVHVIKTSKDQCIVPAHEDNRSLVDELMFAFDRGSWTFDETVYVYNRFKEFGLDRENFISVLATMLIRRNKDAVNQANDRWYSLIANTYPNRVRDQVFFSYCGMPFVMMNNFDKIMREQLECIFYYPPTSRFYEQPEIERSEELRALLSV